MWNGIGIAALVIPCLAGCGKKEEPPVSSTTPVNPATGAQGPQVGRPLAAPGTSGSSTPASPN
jgi:hypothetical protein